MVRAVSGVRKQGKSDELGQEVGERDDVLVEKSHIPGRSSTVDRAVEGERDVGDDCAFAGLSDALLEP